ncbi:MAG: hypothetical protein Q8M08_06610 [Bacteroidales bacterium]|nr:hypothetical protein [Bacteroidales bacterium]
MKTQFKLIRWMMTAVFMITAAGVIAQNQNPTQTVCIGDQEYHVDSSPVTGATYTWSLLGGGTITAGNGTTTINVFWDTPGGPYQLSVYTTANGCSGPPQSVDVTVVAQPVGPGLLAKTPPDPGVCDGTEVSATFTPGSGGVGCSDEFEYSYDNSGTWFAYTPAALIATAGHTLVEIRGRRSGCTATLGCNETPWELLASWTITAPLPVSVIITPDFDPVCADVEVTYTANVVNGGSSPVYAWRVNGGAILGTGSTFTYTPVDGDVITCEVLSNQQCVNNNPATGTFIPVVIPKPTTSEIWHN